MGIQGEKAKYPHSFLSYIFLFDLTQLGFDYGNDHLKSFSWVSQRLTKSLNYWEKHGKPFSFTKSPVIIMEFFMTTSLTQSHFVREIQRISDK